MGMSAGQSAILFLPPGCPVPLDGTPPGGDGTPFLEEVTRIELTPSAYERRYGHDKSNGWEDQCFGIKSLKGSITSKIASDAGMTFGPGAIAWISVWPLGRACGTNIRGYAGITSDPIIMNLENGDPVEHNYQFGSKGKWLGFPNDGWAWGGYECGCTGQTPAVAGLPEPGTSEGLLFPNDAVTPVTGYQWTGAAWMPVMDECRSGFVKGPAPTTPGTYAGELRYVECVIA